MRTAGWLTAAVALTSAVYIFVWLRAPAGATYTWILPPYPEDALAYCAWVRQAALGAVLFTLKFTALPQRAVVFNPFFLVAGWCCRWTGFGAGFILFCLRAVGVALFFFILERLLRRFPLSDRQRILALAFIALSSGFGAWSATRPFAAVDAKPSMDTWFVDANTLWSLVWNPLFPFSLSLILVVVLLIQDGYAREKDTPFLWAGAVMSLLALVHPYDVGALCFVVLATGVYGRRWRGLPMFALAAAPGIVYQIVLSLRDPFIARHATMGWMSTPGLIDVLWGFGIPALLAIVGVGSVFRRNQIRELWPMLMWIIGGLDMAYAPVWFQRKLLAGIHLPICVFAGIGADAILSAIAAPAIYWACAAALVLFSGATHVTNLRSALRQINDPKQTQYYVDRDLASLLNRLSAKSRPDEIVLSSISTSELVPGWSGNTVVWGHWAQTVDQAERDAWAAKILEPKSGLSSESRLDALQRDRIQWVLVDDSLRKTLGGTTPDWLLSASQETVRAGSYELIHL